LSEIRRENEVMEPSHARESLVETEEKFRIAFENARHEHHQLEGSVPKREHGPLLDGVTNVIMPSMNGQELAAKLEASSPNIYVLFTSGYTHTSLPSA